jgi:hypothetical protein
VDRAEAAINRAINSGMTGRSLTLHELDGFEIEKKNGRSVYSELK